MLLGISWVIWFAVLVLIVCFIHGELNKDKGNAIAVALVFDLILFILYGFYKWKIM